MSALEIRPAPTWREKLHFLTFPWRVYRGDPLWVPLVLSERLKAIEQQAFF